MTVGEIPTIRRHDPSVLPASSGYSQIVDVDASRLVFISGQVALDCGGTLIGRNNFARQAEQVFRNLGLALAAIGCGAEHLVKLTVYVKDMTNIAVYRRARDAFFSSVAPAAAPAITLVAVRSLFHEDLLIEIEAVAARV